MAGGARHHSSSSSSRRTTTVTTLPPRSRATTATRATNVRPPAPSGVGAPQGPTASTSSCQCTSAPHARVTTPHQQHDADATRPTDAPALSRAGTPQSPRQKRAFKRAAQRHPPQHHAATGIQGHRASPAWSGAVPSPTNTGAVGTRPEQPPGTAHPHMDPTPQPQSPPGASTHGHQPAASQAAATQAYPEPVHAMAHLTGRQRAKHTRHPKTPPRRHVPLPKPTPPPPGPATPCTPTPTTPPRALIPRLRRHPAQRPPGTCRPRHKPNRRPSGATPHQPGRRYGSQNRDLPVAPPPTPTQVQTRHAAPSRLTLRDPQAREANRGRRPCLKATPERRRDRRTTQSRCPHRQPNHNTRSPRWTRRKYRDPHYGQQHHHQ